MRVPPRVVLDTNPVLSALVLNITEPFACPIIPPAALLDLIRRA